MKISVGSMNISIHFNHSKELLYVKKLKREVQIPVATSCTIKNELTDNIMGIGKATCSKKDNFEYEKGRRIALKRALDKTSFYRSGRQTIWAAYFENKTKK